VMIVNTGNSVKPISVNAPASDAQPSNEMNSATAAWLLKLAVKASEATAMILALIIFSLVGS
jgi:hypothetical protein